MAVPTMTNNSPVAGSIAWAAFTIQLNGVAYSVSAGSTTQRWVWWTYNNGVPVINAGADVPTTLNDNDLVLFGNKNGIAVRVQSSNFIDGELLVDGSILADALSVNIINSQHIVTAGLDAGVIKFGVMSGDRIAVNTLSGTTIIADTIGVKQLVVTNFDNLVGDPDFALANGTGWSGFSSIAINGAQGGLANCGVLAPNAATIYPVAQPSFDIATKNGDSYYCRAVVGTDIALPAGVVMIRVRFIATDGSLVDFTAGTSNPAMAAGEYVELSGMVSCPTTAGKTYVKCGYFFTVNPHATQTLKIEQPSMSRAADAKLIVDGSITANEIKADTITANEIATGAITSTEIATGAVTALKIAANTITANEIASSAITADELAAGSVVSTHVATAGLDAAVIKFGSMSGDRILARSLDVGTLRVADTTNMCPDPGFDGFGWVFGGTAYIDQNFVDKSGTKSGVAILYYGTSSVADSIMIPAKAGEEYSLTWDMCASGLATGNYVVRLSWYKADGTYLSYTDMMGNTGASVSTTWNTFSRYTTAPADVGNVKIHIERYAGPYDAYLAFDRVKLNRRFGGELLVEGAIYGKSYKTNTGYDDIEIVPGDAFTQSAMRFLSDGPGIDNTIPATLSMYDSAGTINSVAGWNSTLTLQGAKYGVIGGGGPRPRIDISSWRAQSSGNISQADMAFHAGGTGGWKGTHFFYIDGVIIQNVQEDGLTLQTNKAIGIGTPAFNARATVGNNSLYAVGSIKTLQQVICDSGFVSLDQVGGAVGGASFTTSGRLARTSTIKMKENLEVMTEDEARSVLGLVSYTGEFKEADGFKDPRRYPFFVAEQAAEVGAELWVGRQHKVVRDDEGKVLEIVRDKKGPIIDFRTESIAVAHNLLIKDLFERIEALEGAQECRHCHASK